VPSTDELRIDTPEQIALEIPIAGIGSRFLALAIDTLLQVALVTLAVLLFAVGGPAVIGLLGGVASSYFAFGPAIAVLFIFCVYWGYFAVFEILWKGQTPGKRFAHIRVVKDSGRPIDTPAAVLRNLLRAVDLLPGMYAVGIACMMLNKHSRRLGDFVAGTVVVHDRRPAEFSVDWQTAAERTAATANPMAARVSEAELVLIETFLQRRADLDWVVRERTSREIARRIIESTGLQPEPRQQVEDFLEGAARQARDVARFR
jgi:uncharacterized RDD family membrane protein YckC